MVNDIIFYKSFVFNTFHFVNYKFTDNTNGIHVNYFAYMTKGNARLVSADGEVTLCEGDIFFIPCGCKYRSYWYGEPQIEFISLGFVFMPNFDGKYYPPQVISHSDEAVEMMKEIALQPALDCVTVGKFYTLVGLLMPNMTYRHGGKHTELIEKASRLIAENPSLTVKEIAKACAVSESSLYFTFKHHSDKSLGDIKRSVIMEKSKELIVSTDRSVEEISRILNFSSSAYFRKCFKEFFGVSPREMREKYKI